MPKRDSRDEFGEYSGKPGLIQKAEDGHADLTAGEQAQVLRTLGKRTHTASTDDASALSVDGGEERVTGEVWEDAVQRRRKLDVQDARDRLNGRGLGDVR